jgi:hypothetical protein
MSTINVASATVVKVTTIGSNGAGPISIPGLEVGDALALILPYGFISGFSFEGVVSTAGQLQQLQNLDWTTVDFTLYFLRGV